MKNNRKLLPILPVLVAFLLACCTPFQIPTSQAGLSPVNMTVTALLEMHTSTAAALQATSIGASPLATPSPAFTAPLSKTSKPVKPKPSGTQIAEPLITGKSPTKTPKASIRKGASVAASFLDKPPVLDGIWDEWTTPAYPVTNVVYGADQLTDKNDLGASFRIAWDDNYLYLAVKVGDDSYVQRDTGVDIYRGDSLEISLDTELQADFDSSQLNSDDYMLRISPGNPDPGKNPEAYLWFPRNVAGSLTKVRIGAVGGENVYRIETAIPWGTYGITPQPGMHFGFALRVNDDDDVDLDIQQSAIANLPGASLADPTTWGDLVLTK